MVNQFIIHICTHTDVIKNNSSALIITSKITLSIEFAINKQYSSYISGVKVILTYVTLFTLLEK